MATMSASSSTPSAAAIPSDVDECERLLRGIVLPPRTQSMVDDPEPAAFSPSIRVGSGKHALAVEQLQASGVTAVLNCAASACHDCSEKYAAAGIAYLAIHAEDVSGYALLERHLEEATAFLQAHDVVLIHCFAGANRSAALAIAHLLLSTREPLEPLVRRCFEARPFILSNESFRRQLAQLASRHGLLLGDAAAASSADVAMGDADDAASASSTDGYTLAEVLGEGAFAIVRRCVLRRRGAAALEVAAKVVSRKTEFVWVGGRSVPSARAYESVVTEVRALRHAGAHANVIRLEEYVEEGERALLFLEMASGGDLHALLRGHPDGVGEAAACRHCHGLIAALAHIHGRGVVHRDVKLANVLIAADGLVRLCDFGHAAIVGAAGERLHERSGTRSFCAPEIIACGAEGYEGPPADLWSAGVVAFALLSGHLPFDVADDGADWRFAKVAEAQAAGASACATVYGWMEREVRRALAARAGHRLHGSSALPWSESCVALVDALLSAAPDRRPTAAAAETAAWLAPARGVRHVGWVASGVPTATRADTLADPRQRRPPVKRTATLGWLREDESRKAIPLVEADRPFKVAKANNNSYAWGYTAPAAVAAWGYGSATPSLASQQAPAPKSRRTAPWAT